MVVHQGGVGTTAQCLRAGKPMLIMPYSHDQPDNARRMQRMQLSSTVERKAYTPERVARTLAHMLADKELAERARSIGVQIRQEDGVRTACNALEKLLERGPRARSKAAADRGSL